MSAVVFSGTKVRALKNKLDLNGSAIIDGSSVSASTVIISDASKNIISSSVSLTELNSVSGATGNLQAQINTKLSTSGTLAGSAIFFNNSGSAVTDSDLTFDSSTNTLNSQNINLDNDTATSSGASAIFDKTRSGPINANDQIGVLVFKGNVAGSDTIVGTIQNIKVSSTGSESLFILSTNNTQLLSVGNNSVSAKVDTYVKGTIQVQDPGVGSQSIGIKAPTGIAGNTYTLPASAPSVNGQALTSDTSGNMSWSTVATATTGDIAPTSKTVAAAGTVTLFSMAGINSAFLYASIENTAVSAYQTVQALIVKSGTGYEISNTIAGTANFGGVNLDTSSTNVVLANPSVSATIRYRVMVN